MADDHRERIFIPCEFCDQQIDFETYMVHAGMCSTRPQARQIISRGGEQEPVYPPQDTRVSMVIRDEEDGSVYRVFIDDALREMQRLGIQHVDGGVGHDGVARNDRDSDSGDEDEDGDGYVPSTTTHRSVIVIPRVYTGPFVHIPSTEMYEYNTLIGEMIGSVKCGVKNISNVLTPIKSAPVNEKLDVCPICQDNMDELFVNAHDYECVKTLCNHAYCKDCIVKWLVQNKKCPVCQTDLEEREMTLRTVLETPIT